MHIITIKTEILLHVTYFLAVRLTNGDLKQKLKIAKKKKNNQNNVDHKCSVHVMFSSLNQHDQVGLFLGFISLRADP